MDVIEDVEGGQVEAQGGLTAGLQLLQQGLAVAKKNLSVLLFVWLLEHHVTEVTDVRFEYSQKICNRGSRQTFVDLEARLRNFLWEFINNLDSGLCC